MAFDYAITRSKTFSLALIDRHPNLSDCGSNCLKIA
jgi:hypothetical protein